MNAESEKARELISYTQLPSSNKKQSSVRGALSQDAIAVQYTKRKSESTSKAGLLPSRRAQATGMDERQARVATELPQQVDKV